MRGRTKRLSVVAAIVMVCAASGVVLGHAVTTVGPEAHVDCLIFNAASTGQTACPTGVQIRGTSPQIFTIGVVGGGGLQTNCSNPPGSTTGSGPGVFSTISPTFATLQGLGPFHVQTPQFNDTTNFADSNQSMGVGGTVTYNTASPFTITDTSKSFPASFVGVAVEAVDTTTTPITAWSGTVASVSGSTATLTTGVGGDWTPFGTLATHPANGDRYQIAPCTDSLGGHTMTVTTNGWVYLQYDCVATYPTPPNCTGNDEGSPEGTAAGAGTDSVGIRVPVLGAEVFEDLAQCDIKVNPTGTTKYEVNASTNDKDKVTVAGTVGGPPSDPASNIPLSVTGTATCPTALTKAAYTGTLSFFDNTTPTVVSPITDG
jgi:hypothetical protein